MKVTLVGDVHVPEIIKRGYEWIEEQIRKRKPREAIIFLEGLPSLGFEDVERPIPHLIKEEIDQFKILQLSSRKKTRALAEEGIPGRVVVTGMDIPIALDPLAVWAVDPYVRIKPPRGDGPKMEIFRRYIVVLNKWIDSLDPALSPREVMDGSRVIHRLVLRGIDPPREVRKAIHYYRSALFALNIHYAQADEIFAFMGSYHIPEMKDFLESWGHTIEQKSYFSPPTKIFIAHSSGTFIIPMPKRRREEYFRLFIEDLPVP